MLVKIKSLSLIFLITLCVVSAFPQTGGTIAGKVVDHETGEPLPGVNVLIEGTMRGSATDLEGNYRIKNLPVGTYSLVATYIGYSNYRIEGVQVKANQLEKLDFAMGMEVLEGQEVVVTAEAIKTTEVALLKDRQKAPAVSDAVGADAISRAGSGDAAEAMKQVTGASLVGGKEVFIRGLGDRYTSTQLNGAEIPSTDPYKRTGSIDLIPSNMVENIVAIKSFTPDKPGNFSGGTVDIRTKDFPEQLTFKVSTSLAYNTQTTFNNNGPIGYNGSKTDWLGFDNGTRDVPGTVKQDGIPFPKFDPAVLNEIIADTRAFGYEMSTKKITPPVNQGYSFSLGNQISLFGKPFGFSGSLSYSRSYTSYDNGQYNAWALGGQGATTLRSIFEMNDAKTTDDVLWGGLVKASYKLSPLNKIGINYIYNINGVSTARKLDGIYDYDKLDRVDDVYKNDILLYNERTLNSIQLNGEHKINALAGAKVEWSASTSKSKQDEPDQRYFTSYDIVDANGVHPGVFTNITPTRLFRYLDETSDEVSMDISLPFSNWSGKSSTFKFGGMYNGKNRDFTESTYDYSSYSYYTGDPSTYFSPENIRWDSTVVTIGGKNYYGYEMPLYMRETDIGVNDYTADKTVKAGYAMFDMPIFNRLRFIGGARFEGTEINLVSLAESKADGSINTSDVLPSVNFVYNATDNMNIRVSATRTLALPTFRELAPYASFDFAAGFTHIGNPELKRTLINNYDFRWEWFDRPGEIYAVSLFYKDFTNPIEEAFIVAATNREITWLNMDKATAYGIEFELRKRLDVLTPVLSNIVLGTNLSLINSEIEIPADELRIMRINNPSIGSTRELAGQSPYVYNLNISYDNFERGLAATVYYNIFGKRLSEVNKDGQPFVYEQPFATLNFSTSVKLMHGVTFKFNAKNLLDSKYKKTQELNGVEYIFTQYSIGRTFSAGFDYSL